MQTDIVYTNIYSVVFHFILFSFFNLDLYYLQIVPLFCGFYVVLCCLCSFSPFTNTKQNLQNPSAHLNLFQYFIY